MKATILPLIDDDDPRKPKILWSVMWKNAGERHSRGQEFTSLERAKAWAFGEFGRSNVRIKPLAAKYRKFLRNGVTHRFALD